MMSTGASAQSTDIAQIDTNGQRLQQALDQTRVEALWQPGLHIDWESGEADGKQLKGDGKHTHCSAFAAAIAKRLGVYLLRPPEHSAHLLANAQHDWLISKGQTIGWNELADGLQAQSFANHGAFVVAVYRNHHDDRPGHIAIIRPSQKNFNSITQEGPQITQAGATNYQSTSLKRGFTSHPAAWNKKEVRYFSHEVNWSSASDK